MMRIDLRDIELEVSPGRRVRMDIRKPVANVVWAGTPDIGVMDKAREIYYTDGAVEIPRWMVPHMVKVIEGSALLAYVKVAVLAILGKENMLT